MFPVFPGDPRQGEVFSLQLAGARERIQLRDELTAQTFGLVLIIKGGMESNELINEGIDAMLHDWQLRFNMINWLGCFIVVDGDGKTINYVARDPPGETEKDIRERVKDGDVNYRDQVKARQTSRITSIVNILAHYERLDMTPFRILGVTMRRSLIGFFSGALVGVITHILDRKEDMRAVFMCHGLDYEG